MDTLSLLLEGATMHSLFFTGAVFFWGHRKASGISRFVYKTFMIVLLLLFIARTCSTIALEFAWLIPFLEWRELARIAGMIEIFALAYAFFSLETRGILPSTKGALALTTGVVGVIYGFIVDIGSEDIWTILIVIYLIGINFVIPSQYFYVAFKISGDIRKDAIKMGVGMLLLSLGTLFQYRNVLLYSPVLVNTLYSNGLLFLPPLFVIAGNMLIIYAVSLKVVK